MAKKHEMSEAGLILAFLDDGRIEATITSPDDPQDEAIYRTSLKKAVAFIANDVGPAAQQRIADIKALE